MVISIISIILLIILSIILLLLYKKEKKKLKKEFIENCQILFEQELEKNRQLIEGQVEEYKREALKRCEQWRDAQIAERQLVDKSLEERKRAVEEIIEQLENRRREAEKNYNEIIANEKERINTELEFYRKNKLDGIESGILVEMSEKTAAATKAYEEFVISLDEQKRLRETELFAIIEELNDHKKKQAAYNAEILRRRELEEKQDFYRIVLSDQDKEDVHYLNSIIGNIKNKQLLYKLIWSEYLQKPFNEMLKRILEGKEVRCVIYKITNLKTGEIYIGKTKAEVSKRWTEHIKTSLNIGTIARSKIHIMLFEHWDEFSFEILEKVSDESLLSSREKFYINFYQSNIYGYNMNSGG